MEICKLDFLCEWHDSCTKGSINSTSYGPCQSCCYQFINSSETLHPLTDPINQHYQSKQTHSVVNQLVNTQIRCSKTNLNIFNEWFLSCPTYTEVVIVYLVGIFFVVYFFLFLLKAVLSFLIYSFLYNVVYMCWLN